MALVIIIGPPAVGKMTVAFALGRLTGYKVHHNHVAIELGLQYFPYGTPGFSRIVSSVRNAILQEVAASDLPGLVFTYAWAFGYPGEQAYVEELAAIFSRTGRPSYFVELQAPQEERLRRNESEFRLSQKPSKCDVHWSRNNLIDADKKYRMNSDGDFPWPERHLKIDNSSLDAEEVARRICNHFALGGNA